MDLEERQKLFENPTNEYRGKPFWAWNGDLKKEELFRQIDVIREMGFGGFFMHSRTGLKTEYLGEKWFELVNLCSGYGSGKGLEPWIYDEDRWPSGSAGGLVTKEEKYRAMYVEMNEIPLDKWNGYEPDGRVLGVFACRVEGVCLTEKREIGPACELFPGEKAMEFRTRYSSCNDNYNGYCYLNTMDERAVKRFMEMTHEKYLAECGSRLGNEIKGVFTDEPHRGGAFTAFAEGEENAVPYTSGMEGKFSARFGYSLRENLPELFLKAPLDGMAKVKRDYFELCQELFLECFAKPVQEWCGNNNLIFTGHVLHEDSLCSQALMQGSLMRFYECMDYPGIDVLAEDNRCYWVAKQAQSVARQLGKKWVLSELYGCTGWQTGFKSYKNIGDWQALFGVNLRCPHLSWYTMAGEAKRDYPASILHQSAWYKDYKYVEDYFARIHVAFDGGRPDSGLLVLNPIESVWARAYSEAFDIFTPLDSDIRRLEEIYAYVFHALAGNQIDFDYGEEDILSRHGKVKGGYLYVGKCRYHRVLVAGMDTMRSSTLELLKEFSGQGGAVIFAGDEPGRVDVVLSEEIRELAKHCIKVSMEGAEIAEACKEKNDIRVFSEGRKSIFVRSETIDGGRMVMVLNTDREKEYKNVRIFLGRKGFLERWDPRSGKVTFPPYDTDDGEIVVTVNLEPGAERFFVIADFARESFRYGLSERNICVLDMVKIIDGEGKTYPEQEVLKADRKLRNAWGYPYRGGEMLQPWFSRKYRGEDGKDAHRISLHYRFWAEAIPGETGLVVEDLGRIRKIEINGREVRRESKGKWIDICFDEVELPRQFLREGENELVFKVDYSRESGIEAVYLVGNFGVEIREGKAVLSKLPERIAIGDISGQGLPFYSGSVYYHMGEEWGRDERVCVTVKNFGGALVKAYGKAGEEVIAFPPYQAQVEGLCGIEVVLTRRNTFGPLHELPKERGSCGPMDFVTENGQWTDQYVLEEQGLLEKPEICRMVNR